MGIRVALVGNPNSGKTTLFNGLTGSNQYVGNWPGVTVEKKTGKYNLGNLEADITDLPGLYSLSTLSLEEEVSATYVLQRRMDVIINIVDASNLERNLFLTHQLLESDIPMVIALTAWISFEKNSRISTSPNWKNVWGFPSFRSPPASDKGSPN
jgi:ferrous iron transport protein B